MNQLREHLPEPFHPQRVTATRKQAAARRAVTAPLDTPYSAVGLLLLGAVASLALHADVFVSMFPGLLAFGITLHLKVFGDNTWRSLDKQVTGICAEQAREALKKMPNAKAYKTAFEHQGRHMLMAEFIEISRYLDQKGVA